VRLGPLRHRNFRAVFFGQAASTLGNALVPVALAFAVLRLTGSASDLGWVLTSTYIAQLALYIAGGVVADRLSRRTVMITADTTRFLSQGLLGLVLITGHPAIGVIIALAVIEGLAGGVFTPAAQGLTPALVPAEDLHAANTLQSMSGSAAYVIGPAVGGILVATVGPGWAILGDAATYAINIAMLSRVRLELPPREHKASFLRDMAEGWREFRVRRWYLWTVVTIAVLNMFSTTYFVLGPVVARRYYGGAVAWGAIAASGSVGALIGGLGIMRLRLRHPLRLGVGAAALFSVVMIALGLHLPLVLTCVLAAVAVLGPVTCNTVIYTAIGHLVPEHLLSRLIAYDYFIAFLLLPVGAALAAPASNHFGLSETLIATGLIQLIGPFLILMIRSVWTLEDPAYAAPDSEPGALPVP
jgi:MFS family permease